MTPEKILSLVGIYEERLEQANIPVQRMDPTRTFGSLSPDEVLAHAHFLCSGVRAYAIKPEKFAKANRHFTALQMCLSFANWYTLDQLRVHNRLN
jgi:hypothetical protein